MDESQLQPVQQRSDNNAASDAPSLEDRVGNLEQFLLNGFSGFNLAVKSVTGQIDPRTGAAVNQTVDPRTGVAIDPRTGAPVQTVVDPRTGVAVDPRAPFTRGIDPKSPAVDQAGQVDPRNRVAGYLDPGPDTTREIV